jgi:hypothetical protein
MTEHSALRHAHHAAHIRGLYDLARWLERDITTPVPDHLAAIATVTSPAELAELAADRDMDGPHRAQDGSWFLHRAFAGGVTWQAIAYAGNGNVSKAEQQARTWAAQHGYILVPLTGATPGGNTP